MLDKMKVILVVGLLLQGLRAFFPQLDVPADFGATLETLVNALYVVVPVVAGWFVKESAAEVAKLDVR